MDGIVDNIEISNEREAWVLAQQHFKKPVFNRTEAEMSRVLTLMSRVKCLRQVAFDARLALSKLVKFRTAARGELLLGPDVPADEHCFFIIVHGCVKQSFSTVNGLVFRELYKGESFGSRFVMASAPPSTAFHASEATELLTFTAEQYDKHLAFLDHEELHNRITFFKNLVVPVLALDEVAAARWERDTALQFVAAVGEAQREPGDRAAALAVMADMVGEAVGLVVWKWCREQSENRSRNETIAK